MGKLRFADNRFDFGPEHPDLEIAKIILARQGADLALTIEQIAQEIWPSEWWLVRGESHGFPAYPYRAKIIRAIKAAVRRLRRAGEKIGSSRGSRNRPSGYYAIANADELADTVRPMLRQAVDMLRTVEKLTGHGYYSHELAGQQRLFKSLNKTIKLHEI